MASPRETTIRVRALRTIPSGSERANVRSLITQGPISMGPPADAADVRGPSAIALATDDVAVEIVDERVATPPATPLRIVPAADARTETPAPLQAPKTAALPGWVKPAIAIAGVVLLGLAGFAFATGEPDLLAQPIPPDQQASLVDAAPVDRRTTPVPATIEPESKEPTADELAADVEPPPAEAPQLTDAETDDDELTLLIEADHAPPPPRRRSTPQKRPTAEMMADGDVALAIGDRDAAVETFEQVLRRRPKSAAAAAGLATAHFDEGRFELAAAYATRAVKAKFKEPNYHVLLGDAYYRLGQRDDAEVQWSTAQQLGSKRAARRLAKL